MLLTNELCWRNGLFELVFGNYVFLTDPMPVHHGVNPAISSSRGRFGSTHHSKATHVVPLATPASLANDLSVEPAIHLRLGRGIVG